MSASLLYQAGWRLPFQCNLSDVYALDRTLMLFSRLSTAFPKHEPGGSGDAVVEVSEFPPEGVYVVAKESTPANIEWDLFWISRFVWLSSPHTISTLTGRGQSGWFTASPNMTPSTYAGPARVNRGDPGTGLRMTGASASRMIQI